MRRWMTVCGVSVALAMSGCASDAADPGGDSVEGVDAAVGDAMDDASSALSADAAVMDAVDTASPEPDAVVGDATPSAPDVTTEETSPPEDELFSFLSLIHI